MKLLNQTISKMNQGNFDDDVFIKIPTLILKKNKLSKKETPLSKSHFFSYFPLILKKKPITM